MRGLCALLVTLVSVGGCSKPAGDTVSTAASEVSATAATQPGAVSSVAAASAAAGRASVAPSPASPAATKTWKGEYKSSAATLSVPPELSKVHWSDTQSTSGIGEGTLTVTVDGVSGRATGEVEGPLGPATVEGLAADGKLTASVRRKDPDDRGFTGTLEGAVAGDRIEGTMSVSPGQARTPRRATFALTAQATP